MKKIALATILCLSLVTCKKNEEDPTGPLTTLLTITADPISVSSFFDNWIFITDEAGTILDTKTLNPGQAVTLSTNKIISSERINVTVFQYASTVASFTSYLAIPIGQTWSYMSSASKSFPGNAGTATLVINNFPAASNLGDFRFSDDDGNGLGMTSAVRSGSSYSIQVILNKIPSRIYIASFKDNVPVALPWNNVTSGSTLIADFNTDFKPLDHTVSLNFTGSNTVQAHVTGLTGKGKLSGYGGNIIYEWNYKTVTGPLVIGYNDGFDTYKTDIGIVSTGVVFRTYQKIGPVPSSARLLNYTLSVTKNDVRDFSFKLSGDFHVRYSIWTQSAKAPIQLSWYVHSPAEGKQKFPSLPQEIMAKYPKVKLEDFEYNSNIFTVFLDGFTYDDYIKQGISGPWAGGSTESQSIQIK